VVGSQCVDWLECSHLVLVLQLVVQSEHPSPHCVDGLLHWLVVLVYWVSISPIWCKQFFHGHFLG